MKRWDRAEADALAFPFVAPAALRSGRLDVAVDEVARGLEARWPALGTGAQAREIARSVWEDGRETALEGVARFARQVLAPDGEVLRLVPNPQTPGREILRWRWLSLALPPALLMAGAIDPAGPVPGCVRVLDRTLAPAGPVAHLHLHAAAAAPFAAVWSRLMTTLRLDAIAASPLGDDAGVEEWRALLRRAALARIVLARYRYAPLDLGGRPGPFGGHRLAPIYRRAIGELVAGAVPRPERAFEVEVERAVAALRGRGDPGRRRPTTLAEVFDQDPVGLGERDPELAQVAAALRAARSERASGATWYGRLLVQYLRVQALAFRDIVVDPRESGLGAFVRRFDRMKAYTRDLGTVGPVRMAAAAVPLTCEAVELREGPPRSLRDFKGHVRAVRGEGADGAAGRREGGPRERRIVVRLGRQDGDTAGRPAGPRERGIVYHFLRSAKRPRRGAHRGGEGGAEPTRYGEVARGAWRAARTLGAAIERWPRSLEVVRGLDLASDEIEGPLWLAAPALRYVQRVATRVAARWGLPNLRLTLHVGEDFRTLAAGLRAIHEPFELGLMQREDRLGHALALGLDVAAWCREHAEVGQPRWERALDLAWMLDFVGQFRPRVEASGTLLRRLEDELAGHARELGAGADQVRTWRRLLVSPAGLERLGFPWALVRDGAPGEPERLLARFLDGEAAARAPFDAPVRVVPGDEAKLLERIADALAAHLGAWQTVIEVNPTSNLLIGDLEHPLSQPMFRLRAVDGRESRHLQVALSTDDPTMLATSLADEFAYAWAGAVVGGGVAPGFVRQWLDEAAATSWRARFTRPGGRG